MEKKITGTTFLMLRKDGKHVMAHQSSFVKTIGDTMVVNGSTYYIFEITISLNHAKIAANCYAVAYHMEEAKRALPTIFK